jgi:hypothetical protein
LHYGSFFGVYKASWLETSCIAVQRTEVLSLGFTDRLRLFASLIDIGAKAQLEVLSGTTSILELLKLDLVLDNHGRCLVAITPASIADLSEREVEVGTSDTHPVTDTLRVLLQLLSLTQLLASLRLLLCARYGYGTSNFVLFVLGQFSAGFIWNISLLNICRGLDRLAKQMLRLAVGVLLALNLETAIAFLATEEIVVLASTADPPIIRELKLILGRRVFF